MADWFHKNVRTLWFKEVYKGPILRGEKTFTIRRQPVHCAPGDLVPASVGPRRPFAILRITAFRYVTRADDPAEDWETYDALYPGVAILAKIEFVVHEDLSAVNP